MVSILAPRTVWFLSNTLFGVIVVACLTLLFLAQPEAPPHRPRTFWLFMASGYLLAVALVAAGFGFLLPSGSGILLVGLVWALLGALVQLVSLLLPSGSEDSGIES